MTSPVPGPVSTEATATRSQRIAGPVTDRPPLAMASSSHGSSSASQASPCRQARGTAPGLGPAGAVVAGGRSQSGSAAGGTRGADPETGCAREIAGREPAKGHSKRVIAAPGRSSGPASLPEGDRAPPASRRRPGPTTPGTRQRPQRPSGPPQRESRLVGVAQERQVSDAEGGARAGGGRFPLAAVAGAGVGARTDAWPPRQPGRPGDRAGNTVVDHSAQQAVQSGRYPAVAPVEGASRSRISAGSAARICGSGGVDPHQARAAPSGPGDIASACAAGSHSCRNQASRARANGSGRRRGFTSAALLGASGSGVIAAGRMREPACAGGRRVSGIPEHVIAAWGQRSTRPGMTLPQVA